MPDRIEHTKPENIDANLFKLIEEICSNFPHNLLEIIPKVDTEEDEDEEDLNYKATMYFNSIIPTQQRELEAVIIHGNISIFDAITGIIGMESEKSDNTGEVYLYLRLREAAQKLLQDQKVSKV